MFQIKKSIGSMIGAASMILATGTTMVHGGLAESTSAKLWADYALHPETDAHIPDVSYAGYHSSESALPNVKVVADVKADGGAVGDGATDDTAAFQKAIEKAKAAGGGAVMVPAGTYKIEGMVRLDASNIVLRGAGRGKTILSFQNSLEKVVEPFHVGTKSCWSWFGGLVWIGPPGTFDSEGKFTRQKTYYDWMSDKTLGAVTSEAKQGTNSITVAAETAANIKAGDLVLLCWTDPADHSFLQTIAGDPSMSKADWGDLAGAEWKWPVRIAKVSGTTIVLRQPLRVDVRPEWNVTIKATGPAVQETGVEHLTIQFPAHKQAPHLNDPGFNAVLMNNAADCWLNDVALINCDNGVMLSVAKNCTVNNFVLSGGGNHHGTYGQRVHDCIVENFRIESKPMHGINTEGMSSGNVWRNGVMLNGTFDSHCGMAFDLLRENIELNSTGNPGGAGGAGPFLGKRVVHWNNRLVSGNAEWCFDPAYLPSGAIVGGHGNLFTKETKLWHMPNGLDKGCVIADLNQVPTPPSLFEAELKLRLGHAVESDKVQP